MLELFIDFNKLYFILFCIILGIELISNVPAVLHTPLMSGANAISGIVLIGSIILVFKTEPTDYLNLALGSVAVFLGALNVFGGFFVTARMLKMFNTKKS